MNKKPNPELLDKDNPEWTAEDFRSAVSFSDLPPSLQTKLRAVRGPQKAPTKIATTIRFDADVITAFKAGGNGWQTRINAALKDWLKTHSPA
jgi:uncharacterized protein (DUF4415 family)